MGERRGGDGQDDGYRMTGFVVRDHRVRVPVDRADPARFGEIEVFAREVVDPRRASEDLPLLLFLQGGPGGMGPRPAQGGWLAKAQGLAAQVAEQAEIAVGLADAVLFVVDARVGATDEDEAVARVLRRAGKPVVLVANKVDDARSEADAQSLWSLGLGVAEAMDTAQRGMGLDWTTSLELIRRSLDAARDFPGARVASGCGTDHLAPEAADAVVFALVATAGQQALVVVGQLHDEHPELAEDFHQGDVVLDRRAVLEAEEDPHAALFMGQANVAGRAYRADQFGPGLEAAVPLAQARQGFASVLVVGDGGVHRAQATGLHLLEYLRAPVGVLQAVDHQEVVHGAYSFRAAGRWS